MCVQIGLRYTDMYNLPIFSDYVKFLRQATLNKQNFVIPSSFFLTEVSYERAETQLSRNVMFSLKFRYRPPNDFFSFLSSNSF